MKTLIKITLASLFVLGASQAQATEVELDLTDMLTKTVTTYVSHASGELEQSIKETLSFDAHTMLNNLIDLAPSDETVQSEVKQPAVKQTEL